MLLDYLKDFYSRIEDKWYALLDFLSARGLPANAYADFLEKRGIPSLPTTLAIFVLIFLLIFALATPNTLDVSLNISIKDDYGQALRNVYLKIETVEGQTIKTKASSYNGDIIKLENVPLNTKLIITASKKGYSNASTEVEVNSKRLSAELVLAREIELITARLQVLDTESQTAVTMPKCHVEFEGSKIAGHAIGSGIVEFVGVPANMELHLQCEADGYESVDTFIKFSSDETQKIELVPKTAELADVKSLLIIVKDYETKELIRGARILITKAKSEEVIADENVDNGQYVAKIASGSIITISVSKEGYLPYTSGSITVRSDGEFPVLLKRGGKTLLVRVLNKDHVQLVNVSVKLFDEVQNLIREAKTDFTGSAVFEGIDASKKHIVTAYYAGFLPGFKELTPEELSKSNEVTIILAKATLENSGMATFRIKGENGEELANASIEIYRIINGKKVPLGMGTLKTNYRGELTTMLPAGDYIAKIETPLYAKEYEFSIEAGEEKTFEVTASKIPSVKIIRLVDKEGNPIKGRAVVTTLSGEELYNGPIRNGQVEFDSKGNETVRINVISEDGKTFEGEVRLGKEKITEVEVANEEGPATLEPKIEFLGITNANNEVLEGAIKDQYVWAKFRVTFPSCEEGGVHIRVGRDDIRFADSQAVGIYGFDGRASSFTYGLSYHAPLGQVTDLANRGRAGIKNKWININFKNPANEVLFAVKIKADKAFSAESFELHYRAWAKVAGSIYRDPADEVLLLQPYNDQKHGLYAETYKENIRVLESAAECEEGICLKMEFFDGSERIPAEQFRPRVGKDYMLIVEITSMQDGQGKITVATQNEPMTLLFSQIRDPKIGLLPRDNYTNIEVYAPIALAKGISREVGAAFQTMSEGGAKITVTIEIGEKTVSRELYFNIYGPKRLGVTLSEPENVPLGNNLEVFVKDQETGEPVTNARIVLSKAARPIIETLGDGTQDNGANGRYVLKTSELSPGKYELTIEAEDSEPYNQELVIGAEKIIEIESPIEIVLEKGEAEKTIVKTIHNNSDETIRNLMYEFVPAGNWPEELAINITLPPEIRPRSSATIQIIATYSGDEEATITATGTLTVYGTLDVAIQGSADVIIKYNQKLPEECIEIEPDEVALEMIGKANQREELAFSIKYNEAEGCIGTLRFTERLEIDDPNLQLIPKEFEISPGETKEVTLVLVNGIDRTGTLEMPLAGVLLFDATSLTKAMKVRLSFTDPRFLLQTNDNIALYMSYNEQSGLLEGFAPLYMKNIGTKPIENIRWSVAPPSGIELYVTETPQAATLPGPTAVGPVNLEPSQELPHPLTLYAKSSNRSLERGPHRAEIRITAQVEGTQFEKVVTVWVFVSPAECLKITPKEELIFASEDASQGVITKTVEIFNGCGEIIRDIMLEPEYLGPNQISLFVPAGPYLYPDQRVEAQIMLNKAGDYFNSERPDAIKVKGLLVNSQHFTESNPLMVIAEIGLRPETEAGPSYTEISLPLCEDETVFKTVRFPMQSADTDCEVAYCDALQLSQYIADKIKENINMVKEKIQDNGADVRNYPFCQEGSQFCTFTAIGVISQPYKVYMNHDNLTTDVLQNVVKNTDGLNNMVVRYASGTLNEILQTATGFTANQIYLEKPLKGCGRYYISIQGAVQQVQGELEEDSIIIFIKLISDRAITPECTLKVQNFLNFLPEDRGLTLTSSMNTWLGIVQADPELSELGRGIAEALFSTPERVAPNTSSNKLKLILEQIPNGSIVELKIDQRSTVEANPATILLLINWLYGEENEKFRSEVAKKAKYALQQLKQGSFEIEACISNDETYMRIMKLESVGELKIEHEKYIELYYDAETCTDINVVSNIPENVALRTNWSALNPTEKSGIKDVYFKLDGSRIEEYSNEQGIRGTPIALEEVPGFKGLYKKSLQLCVVGDDGLITQAAGKKIKIKAKSLSIATKEMKEWEEIELRVCGIHPHSLIERMEGVEVEPGEEKVFYTSLGWKGEPESISIQDIERSLRMKDIVQQLPDTSSGGAPAVVDRVSKAYQNAWLWYFATCVGTSTLCNSLRRGLLSAMFGTFLIPANILQAMVFDCGLPVLAGSSSMPGAPRFVYSIGSAWQWVTQHIPFLRTQGIIAQQLPIDETLPEEAQQALREDVIPAAIAGYEVKLGTQVISYLTNRFGDIVLANDAIKRKVADSAADYIAKQFSSDMLGGAMKKEIKSAVKPRILEILQGASPNARLTTVMTEDSVKSAWRNASSDIAERVISNLDNISGSRIAQEITQAGGRRVSEVFNPDEIANLVRGEDILGETTKVIDPGDFDNEILKIAQNARQRVLQQVEFDKIRPKLGGTARTIEQTLDDTIQRALRSSATTDASGRYIINASSIDDAIRQSVTTVNSRFADRLAKAYGEEIAEKVVRESGEEIAERTAKVSIGKRIRRLFSWRNLGRILRGAACDAAANYAGYSVFRVKLQSALQKLSEEGALPQPTVEYGKVGQHYEGPAQLYKYRPYKIVVGRNQYGTRYYRIEPVDTEEEFEEMQRRIAENPSSYWVDDCREYREREFEGFLGCLMPEAGQGISAEHVRAYYTDNSAFRRFSEEYEVPEALIVAFLINNPERINGCSIEGKWYEKTEESRIYAIRCVAEKVNAALSSTPNIEEVIRVVGSKSGEPPKSYIENVMNTYQRWSQFNICIAPVA